MTDSEKIKAQVRLLVGAGGRGSPSALHAPAAVLWFMLKKLARGERFGEQRVNNLRGSVLSTLLGTNRLKFGYYIVSATKNDR